MTAEGLSTPPEVSMATRTGASRHTGSTNRASPGIRKTCTVLLAFHKGSTPDVFTPPGIRVLFTCYKYRVGYLSAHLMPPVFHCLSSMPLPPPQKKQPTALFKNARHNSDISNSYELHCDCPTSHFNPFLSQHTFLLKPSLIFLPVRTNVCTVCVCVCPLFQPPLHLRVLAHFGLH